MSDHQAEPQGWQPVQPPAGQGFPPPPEYPGAQTGPVPQQPYPGQPYAGQPGPGQQNPGQQPYPGQYPPGQYQSGQYPTQPYAGQYQSGEHPTQPHADQYQSGPYQSGPYQSGPYQSGPYQSGPYPTQPYPQGYPSGPGPQHGPQGEYMAAGPGYPPGAPPPGAPRRRRGLWVLVGAATVAAVGAASVAAYAVFSGGGTTLDRKVPADAVAYAEVNLDPPAGQKVGALRYLKHFPSVKVKEDANTLLDGLFEQIFPDPKDRERFVKDVQPWLGKHVAIAADPQGGKVQPIVVAETKDENASRTGLAELAKEQKFGFVVGDGTVVVAETQEIAQQAVTEAGKASLAGNNSYRDDVKAVGGSDGVVTAWADVAAAVKSVPQVASQSNVNLDELAGTRLAASLRFTDTVADLTIKTFGGKAPQPAAGIGDRVGRLPDDTAVAVGISGGDQLVRRAYDALKKAGLADQLEEALSKFDLRLPDDLATVVGSQTIFAAAGDANNPEFGAVTKTSDPARAKEIADRLLSQASGATVVQQQTADGLALATNQEYLTKLASGQGGLGASDRYKKAVPDAGSAQYVVYADVQRVLAFDKESDVPADVRSLQAVGLTAEVKGNVVTMHLRVVVG